MHIAFKFISKQVKKLIIVKFFLYLLIVVANFFFGFRQSVDPYPEHIRERFTQKIDKVDIAKVAKLPQLNSLTRFIFSKRNKVAN